MLPLFLQQKKNCVCLFGNDRVYDMVYEESHVLSIYVHLDYRINTCTALPDERVRQVAMMILGDLDKTTLALHRRCHRSHAREPR